MIFDNWGVKELSLNNQDDKIIEIEKTLTDKDWIISLEPHQYKKFRSIISKVNNIFWQWDWQDYQDSNDGYV